MWSLRYLLMWCGMGMIAVAAALLFCDSHREMKRQVATGEGVCLAEPRTPWRASTALALLAWGPVVVAAGIVVAQV